MDLIILMGVPASGKSSFAKHHFADSHVRLNLDMLRTRHREQILFQACLDSKTRTLVDNTNVRIEERARYIVPARALGFQVKGYFFQSQLQDCLIRNASRADSVPVGAVHHMHAILELPSLEEGFDELNFVRLADGVFVVEEWKSEIRRP